MDQPGMCLSFAGRRSAAGSASRGRTRPARCQAAARPLLWGPGTQRPTRPSSVALRAGPVAGLSVRLRRLGPRARDPAGVRTAGSGRQQRRQAGGPAARRCWRGRSHAAGAPGLFRPFTLTITSTGAGRECR